MGGAIPDSAEPDWLAPRTACDLPLRFDGSDARTIRGRVADLPIDCAALGVEGRRKRLILADMDSTIVTTETLDELAGRMGLKERVSEITARAMRGELDFHAAIRERVAMLAGLAETDIAAVIAETELSPGARELIGTMRANGAHTALVSGGFAPFTQHVRDLIGFHSDRANRLETRDGFLTGRVIEPILDKTAKLEALRADLARLALSAADAVTVGDGANDLPMLQAAGLGVAYHAKPTVEAEATYSVRYGDLTALLYFQGYRKEQFEVWRAGT